MEYGSSFTLKEKNSATVLFVIKDHNGSPIPKTSISTAAMTIVTDSGSVIGDTDRDIMPYIDSAGTATIYLSDTDNQIVSGNGVMSERHRLIIKIVGVGSSNPVKINDEISILVTSIQTIS